MMTSSKSYPHVPSDNGKIKPSSPDKHIKRREEKMKRWGINTYTLHLHTVTTPCFIQVPYTEYVHTCIIIPSSVCVSTATSNLSPGGGRGGLCCSHLSSVFGSWDGDDVALAHQPVQRHLRSEQHDGYKERTVIKR